LAEKAKETKKFTIGNLGQKSPKDKPELSPLVTLTKNGQENLKLHCWKPWPKRLKNKHFHRWSPWPKRPRKTKTFTIANLGRGGRQMPPRGPPSCGISRNAY